MRGVRNIDAITVFSYDRDADGYSRQMFRRVSCCFNNEYSAAGDGYRGGIKGMEYDGSVILRIFTDQNISVKAGDMIVLYNCNDERPPQDSHKVLAMSDNRRALTARMRHWKVVCR